MRKQDGTMKNTYEFLSDLHKSWGSLNKEQKTAIALQMGGKNQMEVFMATMDNFDTAIEATNTAMNAQGSASEENAKAIESLQGHLQDLKRAWEEFSYTMVKSDMLKKGMDILTGALEFLSSDTGQAVIKLSLLATGLNLFANAALGLKGLSLVKLFSGLGKGVKGATDGLKVMQGAQVGATKSAIPLYSAFGKLAGSLFGVGGLVAGIGLLSVALAEYVPIGEKARDIKLGKELKEAQSDVEKTEKKYKSLRDELDKLHEKEKEGTLTDSEQNRLTILENQTKQYERQVELKKQIAGNKVDEYYHTVDPSKLEGKAKDKYTLAKSAGKSDKEALAAAGIHDKIALALNNEQAQAEKTASAQQKVTEAYEHYGKESSQYKDALENLDKAQTAQGDSLSQLENKRKKAIEDYGSEEKANKKLGKSWKELNKEIGALKALKGLNFKKPSKDMANLKKNAQTLGLEFDKSGKKINKIDLKSFSQKMSEAGYSVEDTWDYIKKLGKENPNIKVKIDGTETAAKDLEFVDGKIQKMKKEKPKVRTEVQTDKAMKAAAKLDKKLKGIHKTNVRPKVNVKANQGKLPALQKSIKSTKGRTVDVKANAKGKSGIDSLKSAISSLKGKTVDVITRKITKKSEVKEAHGVRHFASGGTMVNAEVNEQGFEIIQDADTGLMRIVNGGKRGITHLGDGDSVFTHGQSVRMLRNAGLTEGSVVYGHGDKDFGLVGVKKLKGFKRGRTNQKKKNQAEYKKRYNAIVNGLEAGLATLEYKRDAYNWTDAGFAKAYKKLYNKQNKKLKKLNKSKTAKKSGVKKIKALPKDVRRAYVTAVRDIASDKAKSGIESAISNTQGTYDDLLSALDKIKTARKAKKISADEATEYRKEAYKKYVDYNLKQYENDKKTYASSLKLIKDYYKKGRISGEDYYNYLDDLAKTQLDKEKKRLEEQQDLNESTYSLARAYVERQIDLLETENEEQEKQNDLVELQNNLAKARNQRVRIYKEGEGFVYEKDTEAIREATQALKEYQADAKDSENAMNPVLAQWQAVLDLFDELEADYELKALENKVGSTVGELFGSFGTNTGAWSDWIKKNLSKTQGLGDVLTDLDKLVDTNDIINYLDSNGQVSQAIIDAAVSNNTLPKTYAAAITQMAQGMSAGVNTAANLATQSSITAATSGAVVMGNATQYGNIYNFDNLVLPNVTNANEFINDLNNLSTTALQTSAQRG